MGGTSSGASRTLITATLSVRNGPRAVSGAEFWVSDESPAHQNFSPESIGGCSVRMLLVVEDPDAVFKRAVAAGATQVVAVAESHGWRIGRIP